MKLFLNIGPPRSGSTSFYSMLSNHPQIHSGLLKEPCHEGYKISETKKYLEHWNYELIKDSSLTDVILDGSPRIVFLEDSKFLKSYLSSYFDGFRFICLIRNPKQYYTTRFFINYIIKIVLGFNIPRATNNNYEINWLSNYNNIDLDHVEQGLDFNILKNEWRDIPSLSYSQYLESVSYIFNKDEILIVPIDFIDLYLNNIFSFLNIPAYDLNLPHLNESLGVLRFVKGEEQQNQKIKLMKLFCLIKERVNESKELDNFIRNDLKKIDLLYDTSLFSLYYEENE